MSHRRSPLRTALVALACAPLALGLAACGSDDDPDDASSSTPASSAPTSTPASDGAAESPSTDGASDASMLAAGRTALDAVDGTVFSVSSDTGSWEVQVVTADGTENDLQVSQDGGTIERGPVVDTDDDAKDLAERKQLLTDAELDFAAAIEAARGPVPDGAVTGVDLDLDQGAATWDVQFDEDTANEQTVTVDAVTGEVLRTERDD